MIACSGLSVTLDELKAIIDDEMEQDPSEQARYHEVVLIGIIAAVCFLSCLALAVAMENPRYANWIRGSMGLRP